jgi:hypothetical protein
MELFDVLIFGAIFYYIAQAVRRAASAQKDKRPPGSIATEDGEQLSWGERTERALEGAMAWEEKQDRREEEAEIRAELEAIRAAERGDASPWGLRRDEQRRALEAAELEIRHLKLPVSTILPTETPGGAAPSLSSALAGVAAMLDQHAASGQRQQADDPFQLPARVSRPAPVARRDPTSVARRSPPESRTAAVEVHAQEIHEAPPSAEQRGVSRPLGDIPGLGRLTPLQRAIVYGEIFGRPVAFGGSGDDDSFA